MVDQRSDEHLGPLSGGRRNEPLRPRRLGPLLAVGSAGSPYESNINGPALIAAPASSARKLGRYFMYVAQHSGTTIGLAVSDHLAGPWRLQPRPVLTLADTHYRDHIASPDVILDADRKQLRMYFHGGDGTALSNQTESLAVSEDGLTFRVTQRDIGTPYWRVFRHRRHWYALAMPGTILRSDDGLAGFEAIVSVLPGRVRHTAVAVVGSTALVFWSEIGGSPESLRAGRMNLAPAASGWSISGSQTFLTPTEGYEGGHLPTVPSTPGESYHPVRELRDPAAYVEGNTVYVPYVGGGERCIALAAAELPHELSKQRSGK